MTTFSDDLKKQASLVRLTDAERDSIRARVLGMPEKKPVASPFAFSYFHLSYSRGLAVALSFVLVITGTGGTLYAAEDALPGDILYGVKTGIAEPLSGALAISEEAEVRWHEEVATERLSEAEALAEQGRLTEEVGARLSMDFAKHASSLEGGASGASLAMDASVNDGAAGETEVREDAKKRFRALVAAKSASILEASGKNDGREARVASANFVLTVLGGDDEPQEDLQDARVAKQSAEPAEGAPEAMMLMMTAPAGSESADASEPMNAKTAAASGDEGADLPELAKEAKYSFDQARDSLKYRGAIDADAKLSAILRTLVKADAETVTGASGAARERYRLVIERSREIESLYDRDKEDDAEREREWQRGSGGWDDRDSDGDEGSRD